MDDVVRLCEYLVTKPTGADVEEANAVLGAKYLDGRKLSGLTYWGLISQEEQRLELTEMGREFARAGEDARALVLRRVVRSTPAYNAVVERAKHHGADSYTAHDVGAFWHQHFASDASPSDRTLNEQTVCFFHILDATHLGEFVRSGRGKPTRVDFDRKALDDYVKESAMATGTGSGASAEPETKEPSQFRGPPPAPELGRAIFIAHGKDKDALNQLKRILDEFKVPYKVAVEEPHLGRPISEKIREIMESCNCAIFIFTADEEFRDANDKLVWRPSENVIYELGAAGYLYDNRIVIIKEDEVKFASDFQDIGYISFERGQLGARSVEILKELIGFEIVKIST